MFLTKQVYAIVKNPLLKNSQEINDNPQSYISGALQTIISIFFIFGLIYFIYHFILAAYHMISSQGDPKKYEEAQKSLLYAFIGVAIIFSIFAVLRLVGTIFGIEGLGQLQISWPSL